MAQMSKGELLSQAQNKRMGRRLSNSDEVTDRQAIRRNRELDAEIQETQKQLLEINVKTPSPNVNTKSRDRRVSMTSHDRHGVLLLTKEHTIGTRGETDFEKEVLSMKSQRNIRSCQKASRCLNKLSTQNADENLDSAYHCTRPVSPGSVQNLLIAARVLKDTPHEPELKELLCCLTTDHVPHPDEYSKMVCQRCARRLSHC